MPAERIWGVRLAAGRLIGRQAQRKGVQNTIAVKRAKRKRRSITDGVGSKLPLIMRVKI
jgi:hypothetical protein